MTKSSTREELPAQRLRRHASADISDALKGLGITQVAMRGIQAVNATNAPVVGRARTLRLLPDREDLKTPVNVANRELYESLAEDDIVVLDAMGVTAQGVVGDMMYSRMAARGAVGVIVDGAVRDSHFAAQKSFPLFARGTAPASYAGTIRPWERDIPIQCGGVLVIPGDWIIADADGVVVIPAALVEQVCDKAENKAQADAFSQALLAAGFGLDDAYPLPAHMRGLLDDFIRTGTLPNRDRFRV